MFLIERASTGAEQARVSPPPSLSMNADAAQRYASRATALRQVGLDGCRRSALASLRARTVVKVRKKRCEAKSTCVLRVCALRHSPVLHTHCDGTPIVWIMHQGSGVG